MEKTPALVWFRNDLRLVDHPALYAAREEDAPVIALYIHENAAPWAPGAATRWWMQQSLERLSAALERINIPLVFRQGDSKKIIEEVVAETAAHSVYWNRRYFPMQCEHDKAIKSSLEASNVTVATFNGSLLREPWETKTKSETPFRVFTPFWKAMRQLGPSRGEFLPSIKPVDQAASALSSETLESLTLDQTAPLLFDELSNHWQPGEEAAQTRLDDFLDEAVNHYATGRDRPDQQLTSRLSPHLAFGEISVLDVWHRTRNAIEAGTVSATNGEKFLSEIAWREFSNQLLFFNDDMTDKPMRPEFAEFPWRQDEEALEAWKKGETGYPIVDAGMRQLRNTGWMHNRVRMIAASFLIKDLLVDWRAGAAWFTEMLLDADIANNTASWQWVAGSGADAAPFFRIFNPVLQGEKFDPHGDYVREFAPELKNLPNKYIHAPWTAPLQVLEDAEVTLGNTYPNPIVDHKFARQRALSVYEMLRKN